MAQLHNHLDAVATASRRALFAAAATAGGGDDASYSAEGPLSAEAERALHERLLGNLPPLSAELVAGLPHPQHHADDAHAASVGATAAAPADGAAAAPLATPSGAPAAATAAVDDVHPSPPLPRGWVQRQSASRQRPYYVCEALGRTQWHRPVDADAAPDVPAAAAVLPPGWLLAKDDDGHAFFTHEATGESVWEIFWEIFGDDGDVFYVNAETHECQRTRPSDGAVVRLEAAIADSTAAASSKV